MANKTGNGAGDKQSVNQAIAQRLKELAFGLKEFNAITHDGAADSKSYLLREGGNQNGRHISSKTL